jgi:hypothetical protein
MSPLNHIRTTSSLAPPIFYVVKNRQLKDRRFPILKNLRFLLPEPVQRKSSTWISLFVAAFLDLGKMLNASELIKIPKIYYYSESRLMLSLVNVISRLM